ncbi:MAG: DUF624 domain-containing protein [Clostridia bacterium]|nr:DUF624 domain-containing protein [Clostridia bacterium]
MQIFKPESKFSQFIYTALDYIKLGLVFLLFSIPGITTGAAAAAVMTVGMRIERKEAPVIFRPFWQAFKDNFRQGTLLTLLFMLLFGFLAADWYILLQMENASFLIRLIIGLVFVLALLVAGVVLWAFPTLARFELTNRQVIHNAMLHMLSRFPHTLLVLACAVGGFVLANLMPQVLPLVTFFVPAFVIWYMSRVCVKRFRKFDGSAEEPAETETEESVSGTNRQTTNAMQLN